ncbi:hypothetical protein OZX68_03795 [Streptococcaceae bacterium ESL0729]|nr:hypothetical protein OZX68_03795 [Streptococcaceae bacterium ESL0729]
MKKSVIAYWRLRKNLIIGLSLIIVALGLFGIIGDQMKWHNDKEAIDEFLINNNYSKEDYQNFRAEIEDLIKNGKGDASIETLARFDNLTAGTTTKADVRPNYLDPISVSLWTARARRNVDDESKASYVINFLPESYEAYKKVLYNFYLDKDELNLTRNSKSLYFGYTSLNNIAILSYSLLVAPILLLLVSFDQAKNLGLFFVQRGRNRNKLVFGQLVFFVGLPLFLISLLSLITHLSRGLVIPKEFANVPFEPLLLINIAYIFIALISAVYVLFIDALVGRPIYKFLTAIMGVPALSLILQNFDEPRFFLTRHILDAKLSDGVIALGLAFLILTLIFAPLIYLMNKSYSLEQDKNYIRLNFLKIPFYLLIFILVIVDLIYPTHSNKLSNELGLLVIVLAVGILLVFGFLIFRPKFEAGKLLRK